MPYYTDKPPGAESFKQFLRDYADMADLLFNSFPVNKLSLEISDGNWTCREDEMLSFLDVNRIPSSDAVAINFGQYNRVVSSKNDLKWLYEPPADMQRYAMILIESDVLIWDRRNTVILV